MGRSKFNFSLMEIILMIAALVGAVLAIVGLFVSWFAVTAKIGSVSTTEYAGLFEDWGGVEYDFPIVAVQIVGIIAAVLAVGGAVLTFLKAFNVIKIGFFKKILAVALIVVLGILTIVFAGLFAGNFAALADLGVTTTPAFGAFFTGIGTIVVGGVLFLN